ncbi:FecR family protein [Hypericibacter sp.]|uniref:FecR family protein n=1 Tax=Hypericibacter sp. TaxID=2705401 RepID=UPI003D6CA445
MRINRRVWLRAMFAAIALGGFTRRLAAQDAVGEVVRIQGHVAKTRGSGETALAAGDKVAVGDSIVTGEDGKVDLRFTDGSLLTVGPSSRVEVARFAPKAGGGSGEALLSLLSGIIKLIVDDGTRWGRFAVQTETAVAAVRGTEWLVEAAKDTSAVLVLSGTVEVASRSPGPVFKLGPGQGTDIKAGAAPTPPKIWGAARRQKALARVTW